MRLPQFQSYLHQNKISFAVLVHPDPAINYFAQMKPSHAVLVITSTSASLYLSKLDKVPQLKGVDIHELKKGWEGNLNKTPVTKIGINKEQLTVQFLEKLQKQFPKASFIDVASELHSLRSQKLPSEIKKITRACVITSKAFEAIVQELPRHTLSTEQDVALFLEKSIRQQGGELAFPTIVAMGKNAATPHHVTSTTPLTKGFLLLDFGASYQHYCSDMTRVLYLGAPSALDRKYYELLLAAQEAAIRACKLQKPFTELDAIARKKLGKYAPHFIHSLGHGVGVEIHEAPVFSEKTTIQQHQIFTVEPGIYFSGKFGLRIEDTLLFDHEPKVLTTATKKLIPLPF